MNEITSHVERSAGKLKPSYALTLDGQVCALDPAEPVSLAFRYVGGAQCRYCAAELRKKYGGGYCYTCFTTLARCDLCVMSPDRCHLHLGTCREPDWGDMFCQQPHFVYLAVSSGPKVGITRHNRLEQRWVDQGAGRARAIAEVPTRRAAGAVEARLKRHVSDRTDWRKMVAGRVSDVDLAELARQLKAIAPDLVQVEGPGLSAEERSAMHWLDVGQDTLIEYPVRDYAPPNMLRVDQDNPALAGNLLGFIGGYILLSDGVLAFSELCHGDIEVTIGEPLPAQAAPPQMNLF